MIIDLQETTPGNWKALYRGNYGVYTIQIKRKGEETLHFSCSCPSDYHPCKHIPIAEEAINERIRQCSDTTGADLSALLKNVSLKQLCDFLIRQAQNNPPLTNAILLEFTGKVKCKENYSAIIRKALSKVRLDDDDLMYFDEYLELDVFEEWLQKARNQVKKGNVEEALQICRACIEEYADWYKIQDPEWTDYLGENYAYEPFEILCEILETLDDKMIAELLDYCRSEMLLEKYERADMTEGWDLFFMNLCLKTGSGEFCLLQDKRFAEIADKSSYAAESILRGKISFYNQSNHREKGWEVITANIQIEAFRRELTEKLIAEKQLEQAKRLIEDYLATHQGERRSQTWNNLQLQIAQMENDLPQIRRISYLFLTDRFSPDHYRLYKSTFHKQEWGEECEKLISHYEQGSCGKWLIPSVADILAAEKQKERLLKYIEKYLSVENLMDYHKYFSASFPQQSLTLFRRTIDTYLDKNTGRDCYERVVSLFREMAKIENGGKLVTQMLSQYLTLYKNRRAMVEIFNRFQSPGK